jgi:2,4-dienoyl-CoA reductase-like NADH-dependent reductase (Old Yellow Enzyme family)
MTTPQVLTPFTFPRTGCTTRNRVVLAAMTNKQSHPDGAVSDEERDWLLARARGGFGVVTTCAAHVTRDGQGWEGELGAFDDELLPGLTRLADGLRAEGSLSLVQLFHAGVRAPATLTGLQPWSASVFTLDTPGFETPRAATTQDIEDTITAFGEAAGRCARAGFDGVELHGAHGYLLSQFLGSVSNTRDDAWGGSPQNRARFARRVFEAAREATPDAFLVGIRLSPEIAEQGITLEETLTVARWLADDGVDFVHASHWDSFAPPAADPESPVPLTTWFREALGPDVPLVATGSIWTPAQADEVLAQGADLVGLARAGIGNPRWPQDAAAPAWEPERPPYSPEHLRAAALSPAFIRYMRRWPEFVSPGD